MAEDHTSHPPQSPHRRRPRPRRVITHLVVFLLLGAIVNVAVAWACVAWAPEVDVWRGEAGLNRWPAPVPADWPLRPFKTWKDSSLSLTEFKAWGRDGMHFEFQAVLQSGLPRRALFSEWQQHDGSIWFPLRPPSAPKQGIALQALSSRECLRRVLPTRPIWPGFAINTFLYGVLLWLLFFGVGFTRRAIRRRRGLCPACAYPRGNSLVCTECGTPLPSDAS